MLRTGNEYLESVRDNRRVLCGGEWIEEMVRRADDERQKIIEKRDRPGYIKGQDVETV